MERYNPLKIEPEILDFWRKKKVYEKQAAKGKKGPKFYFLQGPPYTSGKFHVGHAWNYSLKDPVLRYKRMQGFHVWDRGGWDMHGLPTSRKVQAKFGLETNEDIEKYGVGKFTGECEKFAKETMEVMTKDLVRWGVWLDHKNAYQPITKEFMEGVWWCFKKAHENGFLYEGDKVMAWCPVTETVAAKHELEYEKMTDDSIYLKFKLIDKENEYLIIWTTTPWTIPFNQGVMVNPDLKYVKAKVDDEVWIIAEDLVKPFFELTDKKYEITENFKGKKMEGWSYEPPLANDAPVLKELKDNYKWAFKVVLSKEYVDTSAGTGLVHMSPGSGPEDQEVGARYGLIPFNELDKNAVFSDKMGKFKGWKARHDDSKFTKHYEDIGILVTRQKYTHEYPIHQRSKEPVVFRPTKQWFFGMEKIRKQLRKWNTKVNWIPSWAGGKTFDNWLAELKDIGVTRQLYWGTPVPIWRCESCSDYVVVGSVDELKKLSKKNPKNLHKPWIDDITIKCSECEGTRYRIPDVGDVWIDAGCTSWISLYYPQRKDVFEKFWPVDYITEGHDQIRGWFNLLFDTAAVSLKQMPFENCYMHGFINDSQGRKMSKSLGNVIDPYEVIDKWGVDTMRYYMMGAQQPGVDMNYNFKDADLKFRNLSILWNAVNWLLDFSKTNKIKNFKRSPNLNLEERHILSRLNKTIRVVTDLFDNYKLNEIPWAIESLYLDLSRKYIKSVREKATVGSEEEKYAIAHTVYTCVTGILKLFAPISPFVTEKLYQDMRKYFRIKENSIHLFDWPRGDDALINELLEDQYIVAEEIITSILSIRDKQKLGVRWPLAKAFVYGDEIVGKAIDVVKDIITNQCNVKELEFIYEPPKWAREHVRINQGALNKKFKQKVPKIVGKLMQLSPNSVRKKLEKEDKFELEIDDEKFEITKDDVYIEEVLKEGFVSMEFTDGNVYVDTKADDELLAEGFMREIVRRIQDLRKRAGLQKTDKAKAKILTDADLIGSIAKYQESMEKRTGCIIKMDVGESIDEELNDEREIKGHKILIGLTPR